MFLDDVSFETPWKNNIQHPTLRFPTSMQQTKFRMLRWCLSIRHYWGSVGFSTDMFLWSFICAVPKCPKHIQVLSTSCNMWLNGLILICLDALEIWTNAILFSWTSKAQSFLQLERAARRMVDDIGSPAGQPESGAPILKNLDEIQYASLAAAWHRKCLRYTGMTCHQHTNVCRFSHVKKT